jgi:hypothetical protein
MRMLTTAAALAALLAMPLAAQQGGQGKAKQAATPHTVAGEMMLYQNLHYGGEDYVIDAPRTAVRTDWNIRSIAIHPGDRWQICARSRYRDPCITLDRSVPDASMIGVEGQIGSARPAPATPPPS